MFKRKIIKENKLKSYLLKILKIHGLNKETLNLVNPNYSKQSENYFKLNDKTIILSNGVLDLKRKINELNILYRFAPNNSLWNSSKRWKRIIPNIDKKTLGYLIFNGTLTCIVLLFNGLIIMNENVFKYKTLQKSVYLIILVIIAVCIYQQKLTFKTVMGLLFIIFGSYLIDITV